MLEVVRIDKAMEFTAVNSRRMVSRLHSRLRPRTPSRTQSRIQALCFCIGVLFASDAVAQSRSAGELEAQGLYSQALEQIDAKKYSEALESLRQVQSQFPSFTKIAGVQTRVAVLRESADAGESLAVFLSALTLRDNGEMDAALESLGAIASADPAGTLTDDALYIMAYLQVMDRYAFAKAREALRTLDERFPESAYTDSAQYLEAIALEQLGNTSAART
ncbi:tetratricopeptide repeat protein, partial [Granulosicoccus sp.]|nr:tetratricopeptide repeat protein [Granulosicoccus sp.]